MTQCCIAGEDHAKAQENCLSFKPPTVRPELISACFFSTEICCTSKLRVEQCKIGVLAAKDGKDCHTPNNRTGSDFYKNCCESCKIGLVLGAIQEECSLKLSYGSPFDESYNYCCNEMKTGDAFVLSDNDSWLFNSFTFNLIFFGFFSLTNEK